MGVKQLASKGVWVILFFSLALNFGFLISMGMPFQKKRIPPIFRQRQISMEILNTMDLSAGVKDSVADSLDQLTRNHRALIGQMKRQRTAFFKMMMEPGEIERQDRDRFLVPQGEVVDKYIADTMDKFIDIRNTLGEENSAYFFREFENRLKLRWPGAKFK